jgi:hypothetical protein
MATLNSVSVSQGSKALRWLSIPMAILLLTAVTVLSLRSQPPAIMGAGVHGTIYAKLEARDLILLPDIRVFLKNMGTGQASGSVTTDIDGRYRIPPQLSGRYQVCWEALGWQPGCDKSPISITDTTQYPEPIGILPDIRPETGGAIPGRVTLKDGTPCTYVNEFLSINQGGRASPIDAHGTELAKSVRTNRSGYFVLTRVPSQTTSILGTCDTGKTTRALAHGALLESVSPMMTVTIANSRPTVMDVVATLGGMGVRMVPSGVTVELKANAKDPDNDKLQFKWVIQDGYGKIESNGSDTTKWETPKAPGRYTAFVLVSDQKGGVTQGSVTLQVGETDLLFSGSVSGSDTPVLRGATVMVNGTPTMTDANGAYSLTIPAIKNNRYVVTVKKAGYAVASRIFDNGVAGIRWHLTRAVTINIDPTKAVKLIDERGLTVRVPSREKRGFITTRMAGATLVIKPNSITNLSGSHATGPLQLSLTTLNLSTDPLPGDYGAIDTSGRETNLLSYGAATIEVRDAAGQLYNLAPGATAQIVLPIHPAQLTNPSTPPPQTIPLWFYDEETGYWKEEGTAKLVGTNYVAELKHFSTVNTDLSKQVASCMRVKVAPGSSLLGLHVRVSSAAFPQTFDLLLDDPINAIFRLIPNTNIQIQVLDSNGNIIPNIEMRDASNNVIPGNTVNSGAALPQGQTLWPPYPYAPCGVEVNLTQTIPNWAGFPNSPFLTFKSEGADADTNAYFNEIDPNHNRTTLGDWWSQNGFDPVTGGNGVRTAYLNNNDLGFGRDMHCIQTGGDVACYVTNYGSHDQNPANADLAQTANKNVAVATVTMEWKAIDGQPANSRIVKFFIYQGGSASGVRLTAADLDGFGAKHAPYLCNNCHGGNYIPNNSLSPTLAEVDTGASFREFDLTSLKYPAANPQAAQEPSFKQLNLIVAASQPASAITDLVNGWYAGNSSTQISTYVPIGWQASPQKQGLYSNVVAKSCRTCHVAQDSISSNSTISWLSYSQFQTKRISIQDYVCGPNKYMPHALITYKNFWLSASPASPQALAAFSAPDWVAFGTCK